jgi:hypothetical protein
VKADDGEKVSVAVDQESVSLKSDDLREYKYRVETCPTTGWKYFYAILPVELLDSDDDTDSELGFQPRYLSFDNVFGLYRHFLNHPVLIPSIGRNEGQKIGLIDDQHKVAGLPSEMSPHDCRLTHINISEKLMPEVSSTTLKEDVGHSAEGVTQTSYTRPIMSILRAELDRVCNTC